MVGQRAYLPNFDLHHEDSIASLLQDENLALLNALTISL